MTTVEQCIEKANVLIEAVPYIQDFRGSLVVVKVGGSVMESPDNLFRLLSDVAFMRTVGIKVILVHGGGKAISRAMAEAGIPPNFVRGLRVTDGRPSRSSSPSSSARSTPTSSASSTTTST